MRSFPPPGIDDAEDSPQDDPDPDQEPRRGGEGRSGPRPGPRELLVKVRAAGVNRPDVMQRKGQYPPPPGAPDIPGLEIAGEIVAGGGDVKRWKAGGKVTERG